MKDEIWRDVVGYEGIYKVSNCGRVKRLYGKSERVLIGSIRFGYAGVALNKKGSPQKRIQVHRLVAQAFIPNPENKPHVNHIDGDKLNNHVKNLEWVTPSKNMRHAFDTGLEKPLRGADNGNAKLTAEQVAEIRKTCIRGDKNFGMRALAQKFNVSEHTVFRAVHFETYKDSM